jgi:hypothetical protein
VIYCCIFEEQTNQQTKAMETINKNGYVAFYKGKRIEVYAVSSYAAQLEAAKIFKAKKSFEVSVVLAEKNGNTVTHTLDF